MNILITVFVTLSCCYLCNAGYGYGYGSSQPEAQSDVEAPAYVPAYMKHQSTKTGPRKTYSGTKTKTTYTKTGQSKYSGTKTASHTGTKTWHDSFGLPTRYVAYDAKCDPQCKNNGICVSDNTCHCPANFYGTFCEFAKKPCLAHPPLPVNSGMHCTAEMCTVTCNAGHKFFDGSTLANLRCVDGQWRPTRADITSLTDCLPECSPPCLNGGLCLGVDVCQCPQEYTGPQCQYALSACDVRKLSFNGGYNCQGDQEKYTCKLTCPAGAEHSAPPADLYTCFYSKGVFEPQPIPHCVFNNVVVVNADSYHRNSTYYETSHGSSSNYITHSSVDSSQGYGQSVQIVVQDLKPKGGTCLTWAGAHYKTFDGKIYSVVTPCQHILVRDSVDHKFSVSVKHNKCEGRSYCPSELSIFLEDKEYVLAVAEDGSLVFRSSRRLIPVPAALPGLRVSQAGDAVYVTLDTFATTLKWDTNNVVVIEASEILWNKTEGLCGTLDSNPENDYKTKDGSIATSLSTFIASWQVNKIGEICDSSPRMTSACLSKSDEDMRRASQFCNRVFTKEKFRKCSTVMDVSMLLETCQWDYCACTMSKSPEECACNTVAVYAKECLKHGVAEMKSWRDDDTCPMNCPYGKIYKPCGPESQPSCAFPLPPSSTANATCVEGCYCPEGLMLEMGKCVPREQCPCRLRNKSFKPGAVVNKDCNTCKCETGEWKCTSLPCGARCGAVGDPHYTTFDGLRYDFMGQCTYELLKTDNLTVEVENEACNTDVTMAMNLTPPKTGSPSSTKSVYVNFGEHKIHFKRGGLILVNGKEISTLPVRVGEAVIRAASSSFVIAQLPTGVDIWWDGDTSVYVDVPAEFHGKTKGLCGTFNLNQKDDFLTPEGDIEQRAVAFANKWKTREFCPNTDMAEPEHPCKAKVENKETAEKYCSKLKTVFEACHWHVDVAPYYESCLYDMCACTGDTRRCLCAVLADYAGHCARAGVQLQWRYDVKECELSCTGGQEYTVCADSCVRSCADISLSAVTRCKRTCVEGCACADGQVLDATNKCVPVGLCPCFHDGLEFKPGYKEVRPGRRERELCTCVGARWQCAPATDNDIKQYPPAADLRHSCNASMNMEFTTCQLAEPLTCKNMHLPPPSESAACRPGCRCAAGLVLEAPAGRCVPPGSCPCHHAGRSYQDGMAIKQGCNSCVCKSGNWSCTNNTCVGTCSVWGDSHVTTFDGTEYDFEGVCTYLLAKGCMERGKDEFSIEIQNVPCGTTGATCSKSVTLRVGGGDGQDEMIQLSKDLPLPDITKFKRIKLRRVGKFLFLDVISLGISLQWDQEMRVYIKVDSMWRNRVKGLCGNYNSDMRDDFQTPSGGGLAESSALIFADSWKMKATCPKAKEVKDHCAQRPSRREWATSVCGALKRAPFSQCHSEVGVSGAATRCEADACACDVGGDCACACAALAAYAQLCASRGVVFAWRTEDLCPMQCDEECSNYDPCISPCPLETCDNTLYYEEVKVSCAKDTCVEGCKPKNQTICPEGQVYKDDSFKECVPRSKCKPVCMTLDDGRQLLEGEVIEEDACHTCTCSKNEKVCSGQPCLPEVTLPPVGPQDEPLKCVTGWTSWFSRGSPENNTFGESVDDEPLPRPQDFTIGTPMCKQDQMKKIECRTVDGHKPAKETGLDVECSLERGLQCKEEGGKECLDFEIRVFCECEEEPFQCVDSAHPTHPHPRDCKKFYECTPEGNSSHAVLKTCPGGTLYNTQTMVCDWPNSVLAFRPECDLEPETGREELITPSSTVATTLTTPSTTPTLCPEGQVYKKCAQQCDKLCDHYKKESMRKGLCKPGEKCIEGCVDEAVANMKCEFGSLWRDHKTCVPVKDCTCMSMDGKIVKPGGVVIDDCMMCQCLDNNLHCDSSDCISVSVPYSGSTHEPMILTVPPTTPPTSTTSRPTSTTEQPTSTNAPTTTSVPTTPVLIIKSTVSPPPLCTEDRYINLLWDDEPLPDSSFSASSSANELQAPQHAALNAHPSDMTDGSWVPKVSDKNQYIQVELPRKEPIYGVIMQGSPLKNEYVTSYDVMYGDDSQVFSPILDRDGDTKIFRGPTIHSNAAKQIFDQPIEAKVIRIRPKTWHKAISVRFELIGCQELESTTVTSPTTPSTTVLTTKAQIQCTDLIGISSGLPVESIEVSSNFDARKYLSLDAERGWSPTFSSPSEWIMFDFEGPRNITGIKTKGGTKGWVTQYTIMYTSDLTRFNPVINTDGTIEQFAANYDKESVVFNEFNPPIHARYLKVLPLKWNDVIEIRAEPVGCFEPYPTPLTIPTEPDVEPTTAKACNYCPSTQKEPECPCGDPSQYYDGENCVGRDQCPCYVGFMPYSVGATFRGSNCDQCICKIGGVTDCKPVNECKCETDLVPDLSPITCKCNCEPCPNGTKICPTSKICLPLDKWCDGLQDCPDDERECTTAPEPATTTTAATIEPTVVTTVAPTAAALISTTVAPMTECPKVECPPGYTIQRSQPKPSYSRYMMSDLPPPRPRMSYTKYYKGGSVKGRRVFAKGGSSKGGFSKGGSGYSAPPPPPKSNQDFTLSKPKNNPKADVQECVQFRCVPKLPPLRPGSTPAPLICSVPVCPPQYTLKLESDKHVKGSCPQYKCEPPPERPVFCELTGRTFNTFDGAEYKYDVCYHILARENRLDSWTVLVRKKCRVEGCQNELLVRQDDQMIVVKPNLMIEYDNYEYTVEQTSMICFQKNSFDLDRLGNGIVITSRKYKFTVTYNKEGDVKIGVLKSLQNTVDGLCGYFDGNPSNDRRLPSGASAVSIERFGKAWAKPGLREDACSAKVVNPNKQKKVWELCDVVTKEPFSKCGKVLHLDKWRNICLEKICACTDLVVNGTKRTEEECRCTFLEQFIAECLSSDSNVDLGDWRLQTDCPSSCPVGLVSWDCYRRRCEPSCGAARRCGATDRCEPGCYCPAGTLRRGDDCIPPYKCADCTCTGAGKKYVTFEKDDLPLGGNCTYLASRDSNRTGGHKYQVYATNGPCDDNKNAICTKAVHLLYHRHVIKIIKNENTKKLQVTINETVIYKYPAKKDWIEISLVNGKDVSIQLPDVFVELNVEESKLEFTVLVPSSVYANSTEGLCGVCAGYETHLTTSAGNRTDDLDEYSKSWQATGDILETLGVPPQEQCDETPKEECVPPPPEKNPCYIINNVEKFGACHPLVDTHPYIEQCESLLCANQTDPCTAPTEYASECRRRGVCLQWRDEKLCPLTCDAPLVYRPCVTCEKTCDDQKNDCDKPAVEGCYCPEGKVRVNNTCIEPSKCFPCDANKEHYAGDEWQEDACTTCKCEKSPITQTAAVSCVHQTCSAPVCAEDQQLVTSPAKPGACCPEHICIQKPRDTPDCEEPKKIDCGFGQVLKQKSKANGCTELACECKPASECDPLPDIEPMEPGMVSEVDRSGCCPARVWRCRPALCPSSPACPQFKDLVVRNVTGKCCPEFACESPKDKCIVTLEWEADPKGGEKLKEYPQVVMKDLYEEWVSGPCRSCRCETSGASCSVTSCAAPSDPAVLTEPRPQPYACCPVFKPVACLHDNNVYKINEKWTSSVNACESHQCIQSDDNSLRQVTTVQTCDTDCQPGSNYFPSTDPAVCCGKCRPVACVVDGVEHKIGDKWTSSDYCTNYTCADLNGTLQVQTSNESCPSVPADWADRFVLEQELNPGRCCKTVRQVACKVDGKVYKEGETWQSADPCVNMTCSREGSTLSAWPSSESCSPCPRTHAPQAEAGRCCARCVPARCELPDGGFKDVGSTWQSSDNCTSYKCDGNGDSVMVTFSTVVCPPVEGCAGELVNDTCCVRCIEKPSALKESSCKPSVVPPSDSIGLIRVRVPAHGLCVNTEPLELFRECKGTCESGTLFNNQTGSHDSRCECCAAQRYAPLSVALRCADGARLTHQVASPTHCACASCGGGGRTRWPTKAKKETLDYMEIPEIYRRFGD